jgi:hypothetical protein
VLVSLLMLAYSLPLINGTLSKETINMRWLRVAMVDRYLLSYVVVGTTGITELSTRSGFCLRSKRSVRPRRRFYT